MRYRRRISAVHNALRNCIAGLTREAGFTTSAELVGLLHLRPGGTMDRRPDLASVDLTAGARLLLDVSAADFSQRSILCTTAIESASAAAAKAREKRRHYDDHDAGDVVIFLPIKVFEAFELGFDHFLRSCPGKRASGIMEMVYLALTGKSWLSIGNA